MKFVFIVSRLILGSIFLVFGLNGFFQFIPVPTMNLSPEAQAFMGGLMKSGYFFPLLKGCEVLGGLLLLANVWVGFSLMLLIPIIVNIVLYHRMLAGGPPMDLIMLALWCVVAFDRRNVLRKLF